MAYCRFSATCKVYMYKGFDGKFYFHLPDKDFVVDTPQEALYRMKRLKAQGKFGIPDYAIERLEEECASLTEVKE